MKRITQKHLARYTSLENQIDALKAEYYELKNQLIAGLDDGATVQAGERTAELKQEERRSVSWKGVVERLKGAGYCRQVLAGTKPTFFFKLVVK